MGNITSLLFLMYFIYAVLGVQLFAKVRLNDNGAFNIHANVSVSDLSNLCPTQLLYAGAALAQGLRLLTLSLSYNTISS